MKKSFKLIDAILTVITVVFVAEAAATVAQMGNSQYFWWIFLILAFLLPYGLISAELSSTYPEEGGLYDWVKRAYGKKWGSRVSWYYWLNFPMWIASLGILIPPILNFIIWPDGSQTLGIFPELLITLAYIWLVTFISFFKVSESKWILNLGAVLKVLLALGVFVLGILTFIRNGESATPFTLESFSPFPDGFTPLGIIAGLGITTIILFNFMGFEVMASFYGEMDKPKKQLPMAIITGGIVIALIYIITSFGIGVAIPPEEVSADLGILDAVNYLIGSEAFWLVVIFGVLFILTLIGNIVSWSFGVNYVVSYSAKNSDMPKIFAKENKDGIPINASIINGIVATIVALIVSVIYYFNEDIGSLFASFFYLNVIILLIAYIPMFPAWLKLRKKDPDIERPYRVPGGKVLNYLFAWVPVAILIITIVTFLVPVLPNDAGELEVMFTDPGNLATIIGVVIAVIIGEIIVATRKKEDTTKNEEVL